MLTSERQQHRYQTCQNPDCERFAFRVYAEGFRNGYAAGHAAGHAEGYVNGHADGYTEGAAAAGKD